MHHVKMGMIQQRHPAPCTVGTVTGPGLPDKFTVFLNGYRLLNLTKVAAELLTFLLNIRKIPGSIVGLNAGYLYISPSRI
jgi:hypothetical protein